MNKDNELTFFLAGSGIAVVILIILIVTLYSSKTQDEIVESTSVIFETEDTTEEATEEETTIEETTTEEVTTEEETIVIDIPTTEESTTEEETTTEEPTTEIVTEPVTEAPTPEPQTVSPYVMNFSPEDADLLVRVAYAETRSSGPEGMALVMNVILNRCRLHNASIHDIVYSPQQFQVLDIMYELTPSQDAYTALEMVKLGWDGSQGALYFCSPAHNKWHAAKLQYLFTYKGTEYYK